MKRLAILGVSGLLLLAMTSAANAHPGWGDCNQCHDPKLTTNPPNQGTLNFGNVLVGLTKTLNISATNTGSSRGTTIFGDMPAASGEFGPNAVLAYGPLTKNQTASRGYSYTPSSRGSDSQQVTVTSNATNSTITLSGKGVAPVASVDTQAAAAGNVRIGTTGTVRVKVSNTGDGNLSGRGAESNLIGSVGGGSGRFAGAGGSLSLVDGGNTTFAFTFTPTSHAAESATVAVRCDNGNPNGANTAYALDVLLSGTGVGPVFQSSIAPDSLLDFGAVASGEVSSRSIDVANLTTDLAGPTGLTLLSATFGGPDAGSFSLQGFTSGMALGRNESAHLQIGFGGVGLPGLKDATLTLVTDQGAALGSPGDQFSYRLGGSLLSTLTWDGLSDGAWNSTVRWTGGQPGQLPDAYSRTIVPANTVTVDADGAAYSLAVDGGGRLVVDPGKILTVASRVFVTSGTLEVRGTLAALSAEVTTGTIQTDVAGTLDLVEGFAMDNAPYVCRFTGSSNGRISAGGDVVLGPGSTLELQAVTMLLPPGTWGGSSKTVLTAAALQGTFADSPGAGPYLGHGVLHVGTVYDPAAVRVDLYQAAPGDTTGSSDPADPEYGVPDGKIDADDIQRILAEALFNSNQPSRWDQGDFNDDGICNGDDIQLLLGSALFNAGPYAALSPGSATDPSAVLRITPDGLVIDTVGTTINGYILSSAAGVFTGEPAANLGLLRTDSDHEISGQMFFTLSGRHLLGNVAGHEWSGVDLASDLSMTYTVEGAPGIYRASVVVPEPCALALLGIGVVGLLACALRRRKRE